MSTAVQRRIDIYRKLVAEASTHGVRTWRTDPQPPRPLIAKDVSERLEAFRSADEDRLLAHLLSVGMPAQRRTVIVPDLIHPGRTWECTPDLLIGSVALEVDYPADHGGGPSHASGWPAEDVYRTDCLRAAGLEVVRARMSGLPAVDGAHNVLRDGAMTNEVMDLLARAVCRAERRERPASVVATPVKRGQRPESRLSAVVVDRRSAHDGDRTFTWLTDDERKVRFYLRGQGRFLYVDASAVNTEDHPVLAGSQFSPRRFFVARTRLHKLPSQSRREHLATILPGIELTRTEGDPPWSELPFDGAPTAGPCGFTSRERDVTRQLLIWVDEPLLSRTFRHHLSHSTLHFLAPEGVEIYRLELNPQLLAAGYELVRASSTRSGACVEMTIPALPGAPSVAATA